VFHVIFLARYRLVKYFIGSSDVSELVGGPWAAVDVRVKAPRRNAIGLANVLYRRIGRHTQGCVEILNVTHGMFKGSAGRK
jgi:hypothetical protein